MVGENIGRVASKLEPAEVNGAAVRAEFLEFGDSFARLEDGVIYELRVYTANPGCMPALRARFRDHTSRLFEKHGIKNIGYWTNLAGGQSDELYYMVAYEDLGARQPAWAAFIADPEWQAAYAESEKDGPLTHHTRNMLLSPTDFSPLR